MKPHLLQPAIAAALSLAVSACIGATPDNGSVESIRQPVVAHTSMTLDLTAGPEGLSVPEQQRLAAWFDAMKLRYGDHVTIDDPLHNRSTKRDLAEAAGRFGLALSDDPVVSSGYINPGTVRISVTRSTATVPGCPDWSVKTDLNLKNGTNPNYGCAINGNLAAMVADPQHLLKGAEDESVIDTNEGAFKTVNAHRTSAKIGVK